MQIKEEFKEKGFNNFSGAYSVATGYKFLNGSNQSLLESTDLGKTEYS